MQHQLYGIDPQELMDCIPAGSNQSAGQRLGIYHTLDKNKLSHPDGRQPIPESLSKEMVQKLVDAGVDRGASIGVVDYACLLVVHLKQAGFINIKYIEDIPESLNNSDEMYYNLVTGLCSSMNIPIVPLDTDMKFDVIIGNPPYQASDNDCSFTNTWASFFEKCFTELLAPKGIQILLHPTTWATPKESSRGGINSRVQGYLRNHCVFINFNECARHFPGIGSSFCYTVITSDVNNSKMSVLTESDNFSVDKPADFIDHVLSFDNSLLSLSIIQKISLHPSLGQVTGTKKLIGEMVSERDDDHPYRVQFASTTVKWSNIIHPMQSVKKVLFSNQTTKNYPVYDDGVSAPVHRGSVFPVESKEMGENVVEVMKTEIMNFYISRLRFHHGMLNTSVTSSIPDLDYNRGWTNEELAGVFGITDKELDYILQNA